MRSLRTIFTIFLLLGSSIGSPSLAISPQHQLLQDFAACAGRFSATMERQWLLDLPGSESSARKRATFTDLVSALLPDAKAKGLSARIVLSWRIEAKFAQARLLQLGDFGTEPGARKPAHTRAAQLLRQCDQLLLSG